MRKGEVVSFTSRTGRLFPIEFGRDYQDSEFLRWGSPLSAQLLKRGDRYEVQISFEFKAKQIEPKTTLGLDRGIYNLASLAVIDQDGGVIERKNIDGMNLRMVQRAIERKHQRLQRRGKSFTGAARRHAANEAVHVAANAIVEFDQKPLASSHRESFRPRVDGREEASALAFQPNLESRAIPKATKGLVI